MATTLSQVLTETQEAKDTVTSFLRQYEVGNLLRQCRAHKIKGFPVLQIFIYCYPSDWLARVSSRFHQIEYLRSIKENARKHGRIFDAVPYCGIMSFCRKT